MLHRLFLIILFLFSNCLGQEKILLSCEESAILKEFFQVLVGKSEAGYVLLNKKPVCIHGFYRIDPFCVDSPSYKHSVALREGSRVWNQLGSKNGNVLIHIADKEDSQISDFIHVLVINRPLFNRVVNENLSLFQYVLGPSVTSDELFKALTSKDQTYYSLLNCDKVLIGAILGFGTQNSLFGSRTENIQESTGEDIPPFLPTSKIIKEYAGEYLPFQPGFGFLSIREELKTLEERMIISSPKLLEKHPEFVFGCLKDSDANHTFITELETAQDQIQDLLNSPTFVAEILEKLTGKEYVLAEQEFCFQFGREDINKIIARGIWESVQEYDTEYLTYFIDGLGKTEIPRLKSERLAWFPSYRRDFMEGKGNLEKANVFFHSLDQEKDVISIIPQKLYYKTLQNGCGEVVCAGPLVSLEYSIFSPLGHCLDHQTKMLNLNNTIPGFAHGVKGMKSGETREICIHPSLAYGFETSLDKCIHLRAVVTLLAIHENHDSIHPPVGYDLSFLLDSQIQSTRDENYKIALIKHGAFIGNHLAKCQAIDLSLIQEHLRRFHSGEEKFAPTTQQEQNLINRVHWNIYYKR